MYIYLVQQKKAPKKFFHMTPQIGPLWTDQPNEAGLTTDQPPEAGLTSFEACLTVTYD